jgi:hypothetical protein
MSETILCPVCETENAEDATNCEVCGERLTPPAPGEVLPPEENVSAFLATGNDDAVDMGMPELPDSEADDEMPVLSPVAVDDDGSSESTAAGLDTAISEANAPDVLYSSVDGTAYAIGTPEYEEGFGPTGEELVSERPVTVSSPIDVELHETSSAEIHDKAEDDFHGGTEDVFPASSNVRASAAFAAAFPVRQKERVAVAPLPQPGVHSEPATLTLYVNRAPVHSHAVDTDETLLGRRDPMADAYPDLDLTEWDDSGLISRKHAYVYRQNRNYQLYVLSNAGTQLNSDMLSLGDRRALKTGDVIVLAGKYALKFELPAE